jgi:hypothetical protein
LSWKDSGLCLVTGCLYTPKKYHLRGAVARIDNVSYMRCGSAPKLQSSEPYSNVRRLVALYRNYASL